VAPQVRRGGVGEPARPGRLRHRELRPRGARAVRVGRVPEAGAAQPERRHQPGVHQGGPVPRELPHVLQPQVPGDPRRAAVVGGVAGHAGGGVSGGHEACVARAQARVLVRLPGRHLLREDVHRVRPQVHGDRARSLAVRLVRLLVQGRLHGHARVSRARSGYQEPGLLDAQGWPPHLLPLQVSSGPSSIHIPIQGAFPYMYDTMAQLYIIGV
jgi:hypothetical protein